MPIIHKKIGSLVVVLSAGLVAFTGALLLVRADKARPVSSGTASRSTYVPSAVSRDELIAMYRQCSDDSHKRDVCIRAFDYGYLVSGTPLDFVRQLCGTDLIAADCPDGEVCWVGAHFIPPRPGGGNAGGPPAAPSFDGWRLDVCFEGNRNVITEIRLTNTDKQFSPPAKPDALSAQELSVCYKRALTHTAKRDICLRAIDAGHIRAGGPVKIIKEIVGEDFRPSAGKDEFGADYGVVRFADQCDAAKGGHAGLCLIVRHSKGAEHILDYFLTSKEPLGNVTQP